MEDEVPIDMVLGMMRQLVENPRIEDRVRILALIDQLPRMRSVNDPEFSKHVRAMLKDIEKVGSAPNATLHTNSIKENLRQCELLFLIMVYPILQLTEAFVKEFIGEAVDVVMPKVIKKKLKTNLYGNRAPSFNEFMEFFRHTFEYENIEMNHCLLRHCNKMVFGDVSINDTEPVPLEAVGQLVEFFFGNIQGICRYKKVLSAVEFFKNKNICMFNSEHDAGGYIIRLLQMPKRLDGNDYLHKDDEFECINAGAHRNSSRYCADKLVIFGRVDPALAYYDIPLPDIDETMDYVNAVIINCTSIEKYLIDTSETGNVCVRLPRTDKNDYSITDAFPLKVGTRIRIAVRVTMVVENIINESSAGPEEEEVEIDPDAEDDENPYGNIPTDSSVLVLRHLTGPFEGTPSVLKTRHCARSDGKPPSFLLSKGGAGIEEDLAIYIPADFGTSSTHCRFIYMRNEWFIKDIGSTNGTFFYLKTMDEANKGTFSVPFRLFGEMKLGTEGERLLFTEHQIGMGPYLFKIQNN